MEYLEFFLYGIIQGLTEFIPISSTAHLKVISLLLGIEDPGSSLSVIIQLGSILAIFWYFRNDIFKLSSKPKKKIFDWTPKGVGQVCLKFPSSCRQAVCKTSHTAWLQLLGNFKHTCPTHGIMGSPEPN